MIYLLAAAFSLIFALFSLRGIADFWLWFAYDRHGEFYILRARPVDNFIFLVGGWFSIMTPAVFVPLYLVYLYLGVK